MSIEELVRIATGLAREEQKMVLEINEEETTCLVNQIKRPKQALGINLERQTTRKLKNSSILESSSAKD